MKIVRKKKHFALGVLCLAYSVFMLFYSIYCKSFDLLFTILLVTTTGITNVIAAITPCFLAEKTRDNSEDERDVYIALKTTTIAARIMFYLIIVVMFIFCLLYLEFENILFACISVSLFSCFLVFLIIYLFVNVYYEKKK